MFIAGQGPKKMLSVGQQYEEQVHAMEQNLGQSGWLDVDTAASETDTQSHGSGKTKR